MLVGWLCVALFDVFSDAGVIFHDQGISLEKARCLGSKTPRSALVVVVELINHRPPGERHCVPTMLEFDGFFEVLLDCVLVTSWFVFLDTNVFKLPE
ncbi:hypothetical protein MTO96_049763 [Rhipicephalus appendiculatus]